MVWLGWASQYIAVFSYKCFHLVFFPVIWLYHYHSVLENGEDVLYLASQILLNTYFLFFPPCCIKMSSFRAEINSWNAWELARICVATALNNTLVFSDVEGLDSNMRSVVNEVHHPFSLCQRIPITWQHFENGSHVIFVLSLVLLAWGRELELEVSKTGLSSENPPSMVNVRKMVGRGW